MFVIETRPIEADWQSLWIRVYQSIRAGGTCRHLRELTEADWRMEYRMRWVVAEALTGDCSASFGEAERAVPIRS